MRRRALIALLALAAVGAGAGVAEAAVKRGTYVGKMSDGGAVSVTVNKSSVLVRIARKGLTFRCSDGDTFTSKKSTAAGTVDVSSKRFSISEANDANAVEWAMTGAFSSRKRRVSGTYSETRRFNAENRLDPAGTITCSTGELTYSARLPKP